MSPVNPWLSRYAKLVVLATLALIFVGGMVTSLDAGLSVPDWPTSYGYNMFTFPVSQWVGGVFFEHTHRLFASAVGLLTTVLAIWIWKADRRVWVRRLGFGAFVLVAMQGVFGGLRVTKLSVPLAMLHACTAQAFLCVLIVLAAALSPRWNERPPLADRDGKSVNALSWTLMAAVYCQLILGAVMRHMKAGLAIGDFPLAFGRLIPPMWSAQIAIHFAHRVGALCVVMVALTTAWKILRAAPKSRALFLPMWTIIALLTLQIALGAHVIWLAKAPVVTTLHVMNGAAILGTSLLLALRATRGSTADCSEPLGSQRPSFEEARA
ncbi:MAG: heme a synthase [Chthoniobacter sp.]|jgi:cytochrome c oxidase assembly protein subunit 15|nr:heme a synthase [Chthoniobacter sp.]